MTDHRPLNVLSIQSHVAYGHAGNAAAVFPLQRMGIEVWPVYTVQFSNHTGYGQWRGAVFDEYLIREVVLGIGDRGALSSCDAVLSGYMGDATIGTAILQAYETVRAENPEALYCCDPVMGDIGRGIFVRPGIPEFMRDHAVPRSTITVPNHFELELLTGRSVDTLDDAIAATHILRERGPDIVVVTSLLRTDAPRDIIEVLAASGEGVWLVQTPLLPLHPPPNGGGDAFAALFLGHYLQHRAVPDALEHAVSAIFAVLEACHRAGSRELPLIAAQDAFVTPARRFRAQRL